MAKELKMNEQCKDCMFFHPSSNEENQFGLCVLQCRITFKKYGTPECGYQPRHGELVSLDKFRNLLLTTSKQ